MTAACPVRTYGLIMFPLSRVQAPINFPCCKIRHFKVIYKQRFHKELAYCFYLHILHTSAFSFKEQNGSLLNCVSSAACAPLHYPHGNGLEVDCMVSSLSVTEQGVFVSMSGLSR